MKLNKYFSLLLVFGLFFIIGCGQGQQSSDGGSFDDVDPLFYSKGNANAKVKIVEYSDYECPFCARLTLEVFPQLKEEYIDTGKVQFTFKDFPIPYHRYTQLASESTYCAGEQEEEKFWDMHIKLFENQKNLKKDDLIKYAGEFDLNVEAFEECLDSRKFRDIVLKNKDDGIKAGITATPTLIINGEKLTGLHPYDSVKKIIDTQLKK